MNVISIAREQRKYDRALPEIAKYIAEKEPFDDEYVQRFIADFAKCDGDAVMWLEDRGVGENYKCKLIDAELLRTLSRAWIKDEQSVYVVAGTMFFRTMRELARGVYDAG
jgi:hypothetical protein